MPEDLPPSLFDLLRSDIRDMRTDFNARLDKLVSTDAFTAEQKRRDDQYLELGKDIQQERLDRVEAVRHEKEAREKAHAETDGRSRRAWAAVRWTVVAVISIAGVVAAYLTVWR
jgi:hypothetical protein